MNQTSSHVRFGVDLGGTKIEIMALDPSGKECFRQRVPTPQGDYDGTVRAIAGLVAAADDATKNVSTVPATVGVGIPGTISPATKLIKNANSVCLIGHPLDKDLEKVIGRPVRLANDADCFALSEATDGAAANEKIVFGAILGTGAGSGIVINKHLVGGPNAITGEWGHNPLPWPHAEELPGPKCYCGLHGCNETFISGTGLALDFNTTTGANIPATEVVARADGGDKTAMAALDRYIDRLARATATVINLLDPHIIVCGGGMSNVARIYTDVPKLWPQYVFSDTVVTKISPPKHGDSSGVRGAAWLWA